MEWISVNDKLPEDGQLVDIWEMPRTQLLELALSLKGSEYAKQNYNDTYYHGWRSTNYTFSIEQDDEGVINCFTKVTDRYFTPLTGGFFYKKLCIENGEVTHWMPLPKPPKK